MYGKLLCLLGLLVCWASATSLDIHVNVVGSSVSPMALKLNADVTKWAPANEIIFNGPGTNAVPHITLYLTDFQDQHLTDVIKAASDVVSTWSTACSVELTDVTVSGEYAMWSVTNNPCLQALSDEIVIAVNKYIVPDQPIPQWVESLPEPERSEKIRMIKDFGSPNVFEQFQPHVTLAWDSVDNLTSAFGHVHVPTASYTPLSVGVGAVGAHGTVLPSPVYATIPFAASDSALQQQQQEETQPQADNSWDYFLLVMRWPGTVTQDALPSYVDSFTLHGMWPTRNDTTWPADCNPNDPFDASQVSDLIPQLRADWTDITNGPNSTSFWAHEWDKHGTCSMNVIPTQHGFFADGIKMHNQFDMLGWLEKGQVTPSATATYTFDDIYYAIKAGAGNIPPLIECQDGGLLRIGWCLTPSLTLFECNSAIFDQWTSKDNCDHSSIEFKPIQH